MGTSCEVAYYLSILGEKSMAMKLVKKTDDYSIYKRGDDRYAVKDGSKNSVNGEEKTRILTAEGLVKVSVAAAPVEEAAPEEAPEEEAPAEEEAPVEEAPAEEAPAEEAAEEAAEEEEK